MTKNEIYDKLSRVLTEYEDNLIRGKELYSTLVEIQNKWEEITAEE